MPENKWEAVLKKIAKERHTTAEKIRQEISLVMEEGQRCPEPEVQALWRKIPKKGDKLTLEEFLDYLLEQSG